MVKVTIFAQEPTFEFSGGQKGMRGSAEFPARDQRGCPVGQITSDLRKSCQALQAKIFRFTILQIRIIDFAVSSPRRGVGRRHCTSGWDAVDASASARSFRADENVEAYGEVAWFWRRDAGAKSAGCFSQMTVTKRAHRGDRDISRKAIAQGMSACSPLTCMLVCACLLAHLHTRPRVQRAPGIPCSLYLGGTTIWQSSGNPRRETVFRRPGLRRATLADMARVSPVPHRPRPAQNPLTRSP